VIRLLIQDRRVAASALAEIKLRLGPVWACDGSPACVAALGEFGSVDIV
jgi:hypothetical protein